MPDPVFLQPTVEFEPLGMHQQVKASVCVPTNHGWTTIERIAIVPAGTQCLVKLSEDGGVWVMDLVDPDGNVLTRDVQAASLPPGEPEPWPRTQAILPHVWTKLNDWDGSVLNETGATATVTVDKEGELSFSAPMRLRPDPEPESPEYDDEWGVDV